MTLDAAGWAAVIVSAGATEHAGAAGSMDDIPPQHRRRLPAFTRNVLRCALPLLRAHPGTPVVYAAEHGDLDSTVALLTDLARGEVLSPALFALSVHNAPPGALSLCAAPAGDHTAIAAAEDTFAAALTEAYARLAHGDAARVLLVQAEARFPDVYSRFDSDAPGVFLTLALQRAEGEGAEAFDVASGRAGVAAAARALASGRTRLRFTPPGMLERAA